MRCRSSRLLALTHPRLSLLQPKRHVHVEVHRRRGGEMLGGPLARARALVELAEAQVAMSDKGAHPEPFGQRERVAVVALSVLRRIAAGGNLAEEPEGPRFIGALATLARKGQGSPGPVHDGLPPLRGD